MTEASLSGVRQLTLFGTRRFWPLFSVQFLGAFNDQVYKNAFVALLTWRLAAQHGIDEGGLDLLNQLAGGLYILPFALCSPTAGLISDRIDKAVMMRWVKGMEIALMVFAAIAYHVQDLTLLFIILFLMGAQSAFFAPIKYGVLPRYLKRNELVAGNALVAAGTFLAIIFGQIVGLKVVLTDGGVLITSVAVIGIAVLGWIASLFALSVPPQGTLPKVDWVLPRAMWNNVRNCARIKEPFFAMLSFGWFWFVGLTFLSFTPTLASDTLHGTEDVMLIMLVTYSVGVALGAMICSSVLKGDISYRTCPIGALGICVGILVFYLALGTYGEGLDREGTHLTGAAFLARADSWFVLLGLAIMASFAGLYVVPLSTIYQITSPEGERGRFVACSNVIDSLSMVLASAVAVILLSTGLPREEILALNGLSGIVMAWIVWRHHRAGPDLSTPPAR